MRPHARCSDPFTNSTKGASLTRTRSITFLATAMVPVLAALAVAGCGSSGGSNTSRSSAPPKTANGQLATVSVANENLGNILVDSINYSVADFTYFFFPALLIAIIVVSFNLLGDGLRDALDPRADR